MFTDSVPYTFVFLAYLLYGEEWADIRDDNAYSGSAYKFNGKEKDNETGYNYYGARYYTDRLSIWLSVDPLTDKYPSLSSYAYCSNNPVMFVDPDGRKIRFAQGTTPEFKTALKMAIQHLNKHKMGYIAAALEKSSLTYYIVETTGLSRFATEEDGSLKIYWNPNMIVETTNGIMMSPTTVLNHELDHALGLDEAFKDKNKLQDYINNKQKGSDTQYDTKEERRVITGSEQKTAQALGEIKKGEVTRTDHKHKALFEAQTPISNIPKETVLPEVEVVYNKKEE